jgi:hypothetical protein
MMNWSEVSIDVRSLAGSEADDSVNVRIDEMKKSQQSLQASLEDLKIQVISQSKSIDKVGQIQEGFRQIIMRIQSNLRVFLPSQDFPLPGEAQRRRMG